MLAGKTCSGGCLQPVSFTDTVGCTVEETTTNGDEATGTVEKTITNKNLMSAIIYCRRNLFY